MAEIRITAGELKTKAQVMEQLNRKFSAQITSLQQSERNVCSMWEGEAKNAFHNAFVRDKAMMDQFRQTVDKYVQALRQIASVYEKAEKQNSQLALNRTYR